MEMNHYQTVARTTAVYVDFVPQIGHLPYACLGLAGEAGEVANQAKKVLRDDNGELTEARREKLIDELGDVLWYAAAVASELGVDIGAVARRNLDKLSKRKNAGILQGDARN